MLKRPSIKNGRSGRNVMTDSRYPSYPNWLLVFIFLLSSALLSADALGAPAAPRPFDLQQPDGTKFSAVLRGDEYASWTETTDGHSIIKVDGAWFYAESDNAGGLRATKHLVGSLSPSQLSAMPLHLAPSPDPRAYEPRTIRKIQRSDTELKKKDSSFAQSLQGLIATTQKTVTVLASYNNQPVVYSNADHIARIYGNTDSAKAYFLENSYNQFTIAPAAETEGTPNDGIIRVLQNKNHPNPGKNALRKAEARAIVELIDTYIDFSSFDSNSDGSVSAAELSIVIILAGGESATQSTLPGVWGHKAGFDPLTLDGVTLSPYTMFGEQHCCHEEGNPPVSVHHQATVGLIVHEFGHLMLGLPDLYDTDPSSTGIGPWGLMGGGTWLKETPTSYQGTSPSHLNAWSKATTNFTIASDIDTNQTDVSIAQASNNAIAKRLWIDKYKWQEYFLVENRQKDRYDIGLPGDGLLIWHVDDTQTTNSNDVRRWVDLEEADGLNELDAAGEPGDNGDPFPGISDNTGFDDASTPNSRAYSGDPTNIGVTGISASSPTMSADFAVPAGNFGDHVRYTEFGVPGRASFSSSAWIAIGALNDTSQTIFDGIDVFVGNDGGATVTVSFYDSLAGGTPSGLIHEQPGFPAVKGWNRLILTQPQPFPQSSERGIVVKLENQLESVQIGFDNVSAASGRSYYDSDGTGPFNKLCEAPSPGWFCGDVGLVALLSTDTVSPIACQTNELLPSQTINGPGDYRATFSIRTEAPFTVGTSGDVIFDARRIELSSGFSVGPAGLFTASNVANCLPNTPCAHPIDEIGTLLDPTCDSCVEQICAEDAYCCQENWDQQCVNEVSTICTERFIFATSSMSTAGGNFVDWANTIVSGGAFTDGLAAGDAICQKHADDAGLPGIYTAWLSTSTADAKDRIGDHTYTNKDRTIVANSKAELLSCTTGGSECLQNRIQNENGVEVFDPDVWTGTKSDGTKDANTCSNWTTNTTGNGRIGDPGTKFWGWTDASNKLCSDSFRLYCIQE